MTTLYRKYRPQKFTDLVGQEYIVQTITNEIKLEHLAHAYLFSGPRGVGKTTLARLLAKAVNCQNRAKESFEPCEECSSCQEITLGRNVDVIEIDAASQTGVDNVRENIIENAQYKPTKSPYKVFIIDEVHMLSTSAFNALLKTLEEPPAHCIFILATTELHKLPATILSRCERFNFKKIPYQKMKDRLEKICAEEKINLDSKIIDRIIIQSEGGLRDAESLLGQIISLDLKEINEQTLQAILPSSQNETIAEFLSYLIEHRPKEALELISTVSNQGVPLEEFALQLTEMLRDLMIFKATNSKNHLESKYSSEQIKAISSLKDKIENSSLISLIEKTLKRKQEIKSTPLPQLPLELLVVEFCTPENSTPTENIPTKPSSPEEKKLPHLAENKPDKPKILTEEEIKTNEEPNPTPHTFGDTIKSAISHLTGKNTSTLTTDEVKAKWSTFINKLSEASHSLTFVVRMCNIVKIDENGLHVEVPYAFHKEKIVDHKNKKLFDQAFLDTYGQTLPLVCNVVSLPSEEEAENSNLADIAQQFGGEILAS